MKGGRTSSCDKKFKRGDEGETLRDPEIVRRSVYDPSVLIYYRYFKEVFGGKYIAVVVKVNNIKGFILTSYVTDRVKRGDEVWRKEQKEERKSV